MSEPIKNAAIEDVLSSIRRLVSEDSRKDQPEAVSASAEKAPRLVLTPSLRVASDSDGPGQEQPTQELPVQEPQADIEEDAAEPDVTLEAEDLRDAASTGVNDSQIQGFVDDAFARISAAQADADADEDALAAPWANPDKTTLFEAAKVEVLTNPIHVPEPTVADEPAQEIDLAGLMPEENSAEQAETLDQALEGLTDVASENLDLPEEEVAIFEGDAGEITFAEDAETVSDAPLGSRIAAMEAVIASTSDQWEPDGDIGDDYAGTRIETMVWQDHVEDAGDTAEPAESTYVPEMVEETAQDTPEEPVAEETGSSAAEEEALFADDNFLDEESLRELVADIVRQELQGALGERITRNVRKLVRREIHRALAAHDLD